MTAEQQIESGESDAEAVAAVRRGDSERYRELIERHERRVFAVAWSRLGDPALAEEAAQEAFIRGYRRLWLLRDGSKFASWIAAIARRLAINLGRRHRSELKKRALWALEAEAESYPSDLFSSEHSDPDVAKSLREALTELAPAYRECLVLFYIEGKSGAEAAQSLGLSESAFRVRLLRARRALRRQLDDKLAGALRGLRPRTSVVSAAMSAILAGSTVKAAAGGATGAAGAGILAKILPLKWFLPCLSLFFILPTAALSWFIVRMDARNFRDAQGFRARLFKAASARTIGAGFVIIFLTVFLMRWLKPAFEVASLPRLPFLLVALYSYVSAIILGRRIPLIRNEYFTTIVVSSIFTATGFLLVYFYWLPFFAIYWLLLAQSFLAMRLFRERPMRMDYNLFLRAVEKVFITADSEPANSSRNDRSKKELMSFARFLGVRWLAINYQWRKAGLALYMPPVKVSQWNFFRAFGRWSRRSKVILSRDGTVRARLSDGDRADLIRLHATEAKETLEKNVARAVQSAWLHFEQGRLAAAESAIGQSPDEEIFVVPPHKRNFMRNRGWTMAIVIIPMAFLLILKLKPAWFSKLKPVDVSEVQVRASLEVFAHPGATNRLTQGLLLELYDGVALPPANLFTPAELQGLKTELFRLAGVNPSSRIEGKLSSLEMLNPLTPAISSGWITLGDLGVTTTQFSNGFRRFATDSSEMLLPRRMCIDSVGGDYTVTNVDNLLLAKLRWLDQIHCLDMLDRTGLIARFRAFQVLSPKAAGIRHSTHNWRGVRGLFYTPNWPVLQDTYRDLAALEILGGLDQIDKKACADAILRLHRGKGFFAPPDIEESWKFKIDGSARDTFCAFESLRILGALDRVHDLPEWKFRPWRKSDPRENPRQVTWEEIEAWLSARMLASFNASGK